MATLTVNDMELRVLGQASWALSKPAAYGRIAALVDTSGTVTASLHVTGATVKLEVDQRIIEGQDMFQVGSMETNGASVFVDFRGSVVSEPE